MMSDDKSAHVTEMVDSPSGYYQGLRDDDPSVNVGPKSDQWGPDAYPGTDDNMFTASGRDEKIIRAKRRLREGLTK